jgi:hypothetical protein
VGAQRVVEGAAEGEARLVLVARSEGHAAIVV